METLEKLIYDLYKKNARQCTDEEIYNALLIYTKNQLFERGYQDGKKKIYYISAEFLIGKLLSNNLINLGIYDSASLSRSNTLRSFIASSFMVFSTLKYFGVCTILVKRLYLS